MTEDDGSNSWKRLRSSQGHARDDDDGVSNLGIPHMWLGNLTTECEKLNEGDNKVDHERSKLVGV